MTDERDPRLQSAYRALGAEEPPRALDEAILGAARRSAQPWTRRWAVPLSLAAVVVLSVTVTLRVQHEQPGIESPETVRAPAMREAAPPASLAKDKAETEARIERQAEPQAKTEPVRAKKEIKDGNVARNEPVPFQGGARDQAPAPAEVAPSATAPRAARAARAARTAPTPPAAPAAASADSISQQNKVEERREFDERRERQSAERGASVAPPAAAPAAGAVAAKPAPQGALGKSLAKRADEAALPPEKELERIAQLRRDGKHEEADKALAEFRKRHPDYKIPEAILERVERR